MGGYLVENLSSYQHNVYVTSRANRFHKDIHYIQGNAHDLDFLKSVLTITHWDAIVDFMNYHTYEIQERIKLMLKSTDQYIFFSSCRVYAESLLPLNENSSRLLDVCTDLDYLRTDEYALSKARQEDIIVRSGSKGWTIVRPYITYSNNRLQLGVKEKETWLFRVLNKHSIVFHEDIAKRKTTLTYGRDVANALVKLIGNSRADHAIVNITGNDSMRWGDILNLYVNTCEEVLAYRPNIVMLDDSKDLEGRVGNKYQVKYDRLYDRVFDCSFLNKLCQEEIYFTPMQIGLKECLVNFLSGTRNIASPEWVYQGWADSISKEFFRLSEINSYSNMLKYFLYRFNIRI